MKLTKNTFNKVRATFLVPILTSFLWCPATFAGMCAGIAGAEPRWSIEIAETLAGKTHGLEWWQIRSAQTILKNLAATQGKLEKMISAPDRNSRLIVERETWRAMMLTLKHLIRPKGRFQNMAHTIQVQPPLASRRYANEMNERYPFLIEEVSGELQFPDLITIDESLFNRLRATTLLDNSAFGRRSTEGILVTGGSLHTYESIYAGDDWAILIGERQRGRPNQFRSITSQIEVSKWGAGSVPSSYQMKVEDPASLLQIVKFVQELTLKFLEANERLPSNPQ
ncbi:MAG: hypothetical protein K2X47_04840 [Bdellovibrionales bacterium]|nr:hypothetical protein [Bdellovibrionales bacterium]